MSYVSELRIRIHTEGGTVEEVSIRLATEDDVNAVVALWIELMNWHEQRDSRFLTREDAADRFRSYAVSFVRGEDARLWIACDGDDVVGYVSARVESIPPVYLVDKVIVLEDALVTDRYRNRGVGERLTREVIAWAERDGYAHVQLQVAAFNEDGHRFWRRMGFSDLTVIMRHDVGMPNE